MLNKYQGQISGLNKVKYFIMNKKARYDLYKRAELTQAVPEGGFSVTERFLTYFFDLTSGTFRFKHSECKFSLLL